MFFDKILIQNLYCNSCHFAFDTSEYFSRIQVFSGSAQRIWELRVWTSRNKLYFFPRLAELTLYLLLIPLKLSDFRFSPTAYDIFRFFDEERQNMNWNYSSQNSMCLAIILQEFCSALWTKSISVTRSFTFRIHWNLSLLNYSRSSKYPGRNLNSILFARVDSMSDPRSRIESSSYTSLGAFLKLEKRKVRT